VTVTASPETSPAAPEPSTAPEPLALPSGSATLIEEGRGATNVLGMLLVMAAETMILGAILAAYFTIKGGAPDWPPKGVNVGTYVPTVVTITAVMSMFSMAWAVNSVRRHDVRNAAFAVILTIVFGLAMANAQLFGLARIGFGADKHAYGTLYYLLIGFHVAQLVAGLIMLVVVGARVLAGHFSEEDHQPVRAVAYFWYYACAVWFAVVTALFLLSPHATPA
jgi:heme/copper-type cytochrome/quinol oxidase subunit 3